MYTQGTYPSTYNRARTLRPSQSHEIQLFPKFIYKNSAGIFPSLHPVCVWTRTVQRLFALIPDTRLRTLCSWFKLSHPRVPTESLHSSLGWEIRQNIQFASQGRRNSSHSLSGMVILKQLSPFIHRYQRHLIRANLPHIPLHKPGADLFPVP